MTVAERMRRDGWREVRKGVFVASFHGVTCQVDHWFRDGEILSRAFADHPARPTCAAWRYIVSDMNCGQGVVGLRSLAQRAKAAARKLARQRRA